MKLQTVEDKCRVPSVELLEERCNELQAMTEFLDWHNPLDDTLYRQLSVAFNEFDLWSSHTSITLATQLLASPRISPHLPLIHKLRGMWEFEYEKRKALEIISSPSPGAEMNKLLATNLAATTLHQEWFYERARTDWNNCLVVGSGPLPTTVELLHQLTELDVTCIDRDSESCRIAADLNAAIGAPTTKYLVADAIDFEEIEYYDLILTTVLTGVTWTQTRPNERNELIQRLLGAVDSGASLLIRSAYGLGGLVYPAMDASVLTDNSVKYFEPPVLGRSALYLVETESRLQALPL